MQDTDSAGKGERAALAQALRAVHADLLAVVLAETQIQSEASLARVHKRTAADTIYHIDRVGEGPLLEALERHLAPLAPVLLIAEGVAEQGRTIPAGTPTEQVRWRLLMDPLDGTRGLMYQKRSAWILSGLAPDRGPATSLQDIEVAVQTEVPLVKQHLYDQLWAVRGEGAQARRIHRFSGASEGLPLQPSTATSLAHGFGSVCRFFPGGRDVLGRVDDLIARRLLGPGTAGVSRCYEDQYIASGGQLYELMVGHDRYVADVRPWLAPLLQARGEAAPSCAHPYDLSTLLIAEEAGVVITNLEGGPVDAPLDTTTDVGWVGYGNASLRATIEPALREALRHTGLWPTGAVPHPENP
ncbi:MAG: inositol monophosphatase [Bacteroidota bacterium]